MIRNRASSIFGSLLAAALLAGVVMPIGQSKAQMPVQSSMNIAAVVNDDLITVYDLVQRISLVIAFSNLPNTPQVRQRIAPDVLRRLISEKLRMQEAKRLEVEVPQERIDTALSDVEKNNKLPPGGLEGFLRSRNIDKDTLEQQLRADLTWVQTVTALFRGLVSVSDQEIEDELKKQQEAAGKTEYLVSEIFLSFESKSAAEVEQQAQSLLQQLQSGADWVALAQNFSQSPTADDGGFLGWNRAEQLNPAIVSALNNMDAGQISPPIRTDDGIYIMFLRNKRVSAGLTGEPGKEEVTLQQLHLPIAPGADEGTVAQIMSRAQQLAAGAADCSGLDQIAKAEGGPLSGNLGTFDVNTLNPQMKQLIANVPAGQSSQPMRTTNGVIVMMVCSRVSEQAEDPVQKAREEIRIRLLNEKLNRLASQHEQKLRLQSFIDVRL